MTGDVAGLVPLDVALLGVGLAVLAGAGLVRRPRDAVLHAGLALVLGWALTGVAVAFGLMAGLAMGVAELAVLWGVLAGAAAGVAAVAPGRRWRPLREERPAGRVAAWAAAAVVVSYLVQLLRAAAAGVPVAPDAWGFWLGRAKSVYFFGGIDKQVGGWLGFDHPEYPPLLPGSEATVFRFVGAADVQLLPVQHWILFAAWVGALAAVALPRVRPAFVWPGLMALVLLPYVASLVGSSLGDEPVALLVALAATCIALWLGDRDRRLLGLAALFLTAAALTKNEGLMLALALAVALAAARPTRRGLLAAAALAAAPAVAWGAWRGWLAAHDVSGSPDFVLGNLVDPGYLGGHADRLGLGLQGLLHQLFSTRRWLVAVPVALVLAALAAPRRPRLALFALTAGGLALLGFGAIYWVGTLEIHEYVDTSAERVASSLALLAAALSPLLLDAAVAGRRGRRG